MFRRMEYARQLFDEIAQPSVVPWTILIAGYIQMGSGEKALELFWQMPERDLVSWTVVISGFAQNALAGEALKMFSLMRRTGMKPNEFTLASVLKASASLAALEHGKMLHAEILKFGFESHVFAGTAIVDMYSKCDLMEDARKLFEKMTKNSAVLWSSMISGYTQNGHGEEALRLFRGMQETCNGVNEFAFSSVLRACGDLAVLEQGKQFHASAIKTGFESNTYVGSALLDMHSKCGSIEDACQLFDELPHRNLVSWNAMIVGCAQHGRSKAVFTLYKQMQLAGFKPDQVTFVGILFACAHIGLTEEGHYYFDSMYRDYGISPRLEHYTCMVGLLGRVGHLHEAEDLINKMPFEPDSVVWRTLLAACSIHGDMELGKRVAEFVLELEPQDDASYVLLSNIYAAAGRWEDVAKTRKLMKAIRVRKNAGCSWIEVKNSVHTFKTGDRSHPQTEEIYATLERLACQMRDVGYIPDTSFVLQGMEEQ